MGTVVVVALAACNPPGGTDRRPDTDADADADVDADADADVDADADADTDADTDTDTDADADVDADTDADADTEPDWTLAPWLGLDGNAPIDPATGAVSYQHEHPELIAASGAGWLRLNFILGPWDSPEDPAFVATYQGIIDRAKAQGLQVYGLVGAESVHHAAPHESQEWIDAYVANFVSIVGTFKDDVRVWESYNEPNNWVATNDPALEPTWYAYLLQQVYLETKHHNGHIDDPSWQVTLVSGPVFTHEFDTGAAFLDATFEAGRTQWAWDWTHEQTGSWPLDGVGMHLYVAQGSSQPDEVRAALDVNLDAMAGTIDARDPGKRIYVSEVGWHRAAVGAAGQADDVETALVHLRADPRVALTVWFCLVDWPGQEWGLLTASSPDASARAPAWDRFVDVAAR